MKDHVDKSIGIVTLITEIFFITIINRFLKRELKGIHMYGCRCNERLKVKTEGSTHLVYTGLSWGRGHIKMEVMLRGKRFGSVRCDV
jgi:hypothetical protein